MMGFLAVAVLAGLHHDQLAAAAQRRVQHFLAHAAETAAGIQGIGTPDHDAIEFGLEVRLDHHGAVGEMVRSTSLHSAVIARSDDIRRLEVGAKALAEGEFHSLGLAQDNGDALRPEGIAVVHQLLRDGIQRLVPGNTGPAVFAPFARSLHRVLQALLVATDLGNREGTFSVGADIAGHAALFVRDRLHHLAILHDGSHGAVIGAKKAEDGFFRLHGRHSC